MVNDVRFLKDLLEYQRDSATKEQIQKAREILDSDSVLTIERVKKVCVAACGLLLWVRAVVDGDEGSPVCGNDAESKEAEHHALPLLTKDDPQSSTPVSAIKLAAADASATWRSLLPQLDAKDLSELKSLAAPPLAVCKLAVCVLILRPLGTERDSDSGWGGAKAMLGNPCLLKALAEYKMESATKEQLEKVRNILDSDSAFTDANMKSISKAAYGLLRWVRAVVFTEDSKVGLRLNELELDAAPTAPPSLATTPASSRAGTPGPEDRGMRSVQETMEECKDQA